MNTPIKPSTLSALIASSLFFSSFVASASASDSDLHAIAAAPSAARIAADIRLLALPAASIIPATTKAKASIETALA